MIHSLGKVLIESVIKFWFWNKVSQTFQFLISHNDPLGNFAPIAWFVFLIQNELYQKRQTSPKASDFASRVWFYQNWQTVGSFRFFFQLFKVRIIHSAELVSGTPRKRNICLKINNSLALWLWDHPMWILFPWIIYKWINNKPFQFLSARPHPTVGCGLFCMILYLYKQQNKPCYEFWIKIIKIHILYMLGVSIINEIQKLKRKFQISLHFMLQDPGCKKQLILY